jgi:Tfp pilus assembly PilM family ATPase
MHVLAIDIGTYSVKYISSFVDRRKVTHVDMSEVLISDYLSETPELELQDVQLNIVKEILDSIARPETRIVYQANNEFMTTRFLTLPVKKKKKAELMLPFQLEEDIPYALSEIHYAYRLEGQKTQHTALVELLRESTFEPYFQSMRDREILPTILTTEASVMENYFSENSLAGPFCVLNLGHRTTRAYFFYNSRLLMTHVSYVGGEQINEMIAQTYKIDPAEAVIYKHQNAFLLTAAQYDEVEPAQREFGAAMDRVLAPLVSDFARWKVGFKVNFGLSLGHVFICGGTSNVKNIANYLTEKWDVKVSLLESFDKIEAEKVDVNPKTKSRYALANMMAEGFRRKNRFINLLTGRFAQASAAELPLHSLAFIGVRVWAVCLVIALSFGAEFYFLQADRATLNTRLNQLVRNDELNVPARLRRQVVNNPKSVLDDLQKRSRGIRQEISTLQSAVEIKALQPLVVVSQIARGSEATLIRFTSQDSGEINAVFSAEKVSDLQQLRNYFLNSQLQGVDAQLDEQNLRLAVTATGL